MRTARILAAMVLAASGSAAPAAWGDDPREPAAAMAPAAAAPGVLTLKTDRVAVFKDGYAMFVKTATGVADAQGRVVMREVPDAAVLGCFWASLDGPGGSIASMLASETEEVEQRRSEQVCVSVRDLLRANQGRRVTLVLHGAGDQPERENEVVVDRVLEAEGALPRHAERATNEPAWYGWRAQPASAEPPEPVFARVEPTGGDYVVVRDVAGEGAAGAAAAVRVLPIAAVRALRGEGLITTTTRLEARPVKRKEIRFDLGAAAAGKAVRLNVMYFTPGVRWIPTYRLDTADGSESASLALQGEVLNEAEDIEDAALDLVVGVPNFRFKDVVSPLSLERTLRNALALAAPGVMGRQNAFSNVMFSQRAGEWHGEGSAGAEAGGPAPELAGAGEQDLYVYTVPSYSIAKGERATLPVWRQDVTLRHAYTFDVAVVRDARSAHAQTWCGSSSWDGPRNPPPTGEDSPLTLAAHQVWHQVELTNPGPSPWTTGAVLIMSGGRGKPVVPIAQELLTYTSAGRRSLVPLTVAVDVRGSYSEEEVSREPNAVVIDGDSWTRVRVRATLAVTNSRREPTGVRVGLGVGGDAAEVSDGGTITQRPFRQADWGTDFVRHANGHSDIAWDLRLDPGQTRAVTAEFTYLYR